MTESTPDTRTQNDEPERANPSKDNPRTAPPAEGDTAPTEHEPGAISDEQLPEDLQPSDDNPLAKPLDPDDEGKGMSLGGDGPQP